MNKTYKDKRQARRSRETLTIYYLKRQVRDRDQEPRSIKLMLVPRKTLHQRSNLVRLDAFTCLEVVK